MYSASYAGYIVITHWCRRRLPVLINVHVSIWSRKLGDIEEEVCLILSSIPGRPLAVLRGIRRTIVLVKIFGYKDNNMRLWRSAEIGRREMGV